MLPRFFSPGAIGISASVILVLAVGCQSAQETTPAADPVPETTSSEPISPPATADTATPPPASATAADPAAPAPADAAVSAAPEAYAELACSASAYVADTDPAGLNVRSGPGSEFEVMDTLPTDGPVEVTIAAGADDWLKLSVAWSLQQQELESAGWVYGPLLAITTRNNAGNPAAEIPLLTSPDRAAEVLATVPAATEVTLMGCSGDWLQVKTNATVGWLAAGNQCSSPVTTCP